MTNMMDGRLLSLADRLVVSFERMAVALEGLNDTYKNALAKQFPERRELREAILTRVPTEEDRIREAQGASDRPIEDWLGELEEQETEQDIGVREREWIEAQKRSSQGSA